MKYAKNFTFFQKYLVMSKKAVPLHSLSTMKQVFLAQLVEQLTLNQWVQGSSPWEDTKRHPPKDVFLFVYMGFYKKIVNKCIFLAYLIKKLYLCSLK